MEVDADKADYDSRSDPFRSLLCLSTFYFYSPSCFYHILILHSARRTSSFNFNTWRSLAIVIPYSSNSKKILLLSDGSQHNAECKKDYKGLKLLKIEAKIAYRICLYMAYCVIASETSVSLLQLQLQLQ